jgi:hypothetical protein
MGRGRAPPLTTERPLSKHTFPVEAGHILMFARAIGDDNPAFVGSDGLGNGVSAAPPTFAWASAQYDPDYRLRPRPGQKWFGSARGPGGVEGETPKSGALHAEQHFEFARPIRPGDVLTVETRQGETWEKASKRGGVLTFSESVTDYRDASGELVCRARMVVVTRGQPGSAP